MREPPAWSGPWGRKTAHEVDHLRRRERGHDDVDLLVRLARHLRTIALHHARAHLGADVRRQAVHVEGAAPGAELHAPLVADPVPVPRVLGEGPGLDAGHAGPVAATVGLDALLHQLMRPPGFGG